MNHKYHYKSLIDLSANELFFWIVVDQTVEQVGGQDVVGVFTILAGLPLIPTRAKFSGATKGTSAASLLLRHYLNYDLKHRVPTLTWGSIKKLRFSLTRNLGAIVGRTVPGIGWTILAYDAITIMRNSVVTYNRIARPEDQLF